MQHRAGYVPFNAEEGRGYRPSYLIVSALLRPKARRWLPFPDAKSPRLACTDVELLVWAIPDDRPLRKRQIHMLLERRALFEPLVPRGERGEIRAFDFQPEPALRGATERDIADGEILAGHVTPIF